ncbi:holo-ACP synthase [Paenibacillus nasutitermitis]|uniref:Holo-[acyl-carrier-protein] synthase n=1 Tax=Paenibacillus nasutitermitis TaxID=1652958 RepID=A0A916YJ29_9BACL|nr:holo-ACP synthase [Paenibacillus nasutitermitis]GGD47211.1 holo-[acyl-carrier-protein] synthase [Paenibacillus nasutitermitis]
MIVGIGHDLTPLERMKELLEGKSGIRFQERILTPNELKAAAEMGGPRLVEFTAGRFAAKEAVSKAFGCGIGHMLAFSDIEIGRDERGKPLCRLSEKGWERLGYCAREMVIHVTITHDKSLASAFVVVERVQ